jgi:predicted hydrocarbon binding protein
MADLKQRFALHYDWQKHRRVIAGREVILHCHHYNSRIQHTVESAAGIDGKSIIRSSAESVFAEHVAGAFREGDDVETKWKVAAGLYAHLGFGDLDTRKVAEGRVEAPASHFVEGWNAGFAGRTDPVCTMTEGYLAGAHLAVTGETVTYRETACMMGGAERCVFERQTGPREPIGKVERKPLELTPKAASAFPKPKNIDGDKIVSALVDMPIHGNEQGLIPAFGVYLANTPADFYNLVCIRFVEEMSAKGLGRNAQRLLVSDAETCAMNTFRGIMSSPEWDGLVAPMVKDTPDKLYGIVAVSNALGWGNWYVTSHDQGEALRIESVNGYEAFGFRELRGQAPDPQCFMLKGVAAGIMALVYGTGSVADRFGSYASTEADCICSGKASCSFEVLRS